MSYTFLQNLLNIGFIYILLYSKRGDSHKCVDLVGVSPAAGEALPLLSHHLSKVRGTNSYLPFLCYSLYPPRPLHFGSYNAAVEEVLSRICQRYV